MIEGYDLVTKLFHLGERIKSDFVRPVPQITDASQLANVDILKEFERVTQEIIKTDDGEVALLGRRVLEDILLPRYPQMQQSSPQVYLRYQKLIVLLKFMNLAVYGLREIDKIVVENLLSALKAGIPVKEKFQRVLDDYNDFLMEGTIAEELGRSMTVCEERIGTSPLSEGNKMKIQTVGNWLSDYIGYSVMGAEHKTGSLERIQYFRDNKNARKLSENENKLLLEIFRLYDWLKYGEGVVEEEEDIADEEVENDEYTNKQNLVLPKADLGVVPPEPLSARGGSGIRAGTPPQTDKQPPSPPPTLPPQGGGSQREGKGEGQGEGIEQKGVKGVTGQMEEREKMGVKGVIPTLRSGQVGQRGGQEEMGQGKGPVEYEEIPRAKGLKLRGGALEAGENWTNKTDKTNKTNRTDRTDRLVMPPLIPKPAVNIDQKLEELKKKAQRKTINN